MPKGKAKARQVNEEEEIKPVKLTAYFAPKKVTEGAVRFVETTASGTEKKNKGIIRTLYLRHDMPGGVSKNEEGECVLPARLKVTISEE